MQNEDSSCSACGMSPAMGLIILSLIAVTLAIIYATAPVGNTQCPEGEVCGD